MRNSKFVLINPKLKEYTAFNGRKEVLTVVSDRLLTPQEVEDYRLNPQADDDFDGEDIDGSMV